MPDYNQSTTLIKCNNQTNIRYLPTMSIDKTQPQQIGSWSHFADFFFVDKQPPLEQFEEVAVQYFF